MALPPNNVSVSPGTHPSESFYSHLSPSLLATVAASASQSGLSSSSSSPFLNLQDFPNSTIGTSPHDAEGEQGGKDKDTKLKEILSHIYQYVSRQYNQRINENLEDPNGISPNPLKKVSKFTDNNYITYEKGAFWTWIRIYHLFGFLWLANFMIACQHVVIAGAIAGWYFVR